MKKVYLVTSEDDTITYGVSLKIEGIFSSSEKANDFINTKNNDFSDIYIYEITPVTLDSPEEDYRGIDNSIMVYPSVYFEE